MKKGHVWVIEKYQRVYEHWRIEEQCEGDSNPTLRDDVADSWFFYYNLGGTGNNAYYSSTMYGHPGAIGFPLNNELIVKHSLNGEWYSVSRDDMNLIKIKAWRSK